MWYLYTQTSDCLYPYSALQTSEFPDFNIELSGDFLLNARRLESNVALQYGRDADDANKRIVLSKVTEFKGTWQSLEVDQTWGLKWKAVVSERFRCRMYYLYECTL